MTQTQMKGIYDLSKMVYDGKISLKEGKEMARGSYSININSFDDFYRAFVKMREGEIHTRMISSSLREYMLERILSDYGKVALAKALKSYKLSIDYYEGLIQGKMLTSNRLVYEKYLKKTM